MSVMVSDFVSLKYIHYCIKIMHISYFRMFDNTSNLEVVLNKKKEFLNI